MADAERVGALVAGAGWVVITGGRAAGVMDAASRGAAAAGGLTIGVLPGAGAGEASPGVRVALTTGLGEARDAIVAIGSEALVACGMSAGTAAEVALALRAGRPVVLVRPDDASAAFFRRLDGERVRVARGPDDVVPILAAVVEPPAASP